MKIHHSVVLTFFVAMFIQGCTSKEVIVRQEASNTVITGAATIAEINRFYDQLFDTQNKVAATIVASDTSCKISNNRIFINQGRPEGIKEKQPRLCQSEEFCSKNKFACYPLDLTPLERSHVKPNLLILGAFSEYLKAISEYTASPETPIGDTLERVVAELQLIQKQKGVITNEKAKVALESADFAAGFAKYIEELKENENDAEKISSLISSSGKTVENELLKLAESDSLKLNRYASLMNESLTNALGRFYDGNNEKKEFESFAKRQEFAMSLFKQRQIYDGVEISKSFTHEAVDKFVKAHAKLRDTVDGKFDEKQKQARIEESNRQLIEGLKILAGSIKYALLFV